MKFRDKKIKRKIPNKDEQNWFIREIKHLIRLAIIAEKSFHLHVHQEDEKDSLDSLRFLSNLCNFQPGKSLVN